MEPLTIEQAKDQIRAWFADHDFGWDGGSCVYRGNDDPESEVRCSVGVLIPDQYYSASIESKTVCAFLGLTPTIIKRDFVEEWQYRTDRDDLMGSVWPQIQYLRLLQLLGPIADELGFIQSKHDCFANPEPGDELQPLTTRERVQAFLSQL